jgi:hypothetical protein
MKYYARAKPNSQFLKPGEWSEVTQAQYESLRKSVKATSQNFQKGGVEGLVINPETGYEIYKHVYPDLYAILKEES